MLRGLRAARPPIEKTTQEEVEETLAGLWAMTPSGRHLRRGGRHLAPVRLSRSTISLRRAAVALAVSALIAVGSGLWFPRATSNASVGDDTASEPIRVRTVTSTGDRDALRAPTTRICPIDWRQSTWHVKQLIRCAAEHHGILPRKALYIAWRESRYQPGAYNPTGRAAGIYQHLLKYWPDRAADYGFANWSAFNARANIFVTMRMVRRYGWDPWAI